MVVVGLVGAWLIVVVVVVSGLIAVIRVAAALIVAVGVAEILLEVINDRRIVARKDGIGLVHRRFSPVLIGVGVPVFLLEIPGISGLAGGALACDLAGRED